MLFKKRKARKLAEIEKAHKIRSLEGELERASRKIRTNIAKFNEVRAQSLQLEDRKKELEKMMDKQEQIRISIDCEITRVKCCQGDANG